MSISNPLSSKNQKKIAPKSSSTASNHMILLSTSFKTNFHASKLCLAFYKINDKYELILIF